MINIISDKNILSIIEETNKIFNYKLNHTENKKLSSLLHQDFKYIIIDTEFINTDIEKIIEFEKTIKNKLILIIDEYSYNKNINLLQQKNIYNIIINYSDIHLRKQLIEFLHNPEEFENKNCYTDKNKQQPIETPKIISESKAVTGAISLHKKHQRKLRKKYNVNTEKVLVVEKTNTFKFCIKTISNLIRIVANILLYIFSGIGIICLIYPDTREGFIKIIHDNFAGLYSLFN
ncbi:MAG: hypothetical protein KFW09_01590 [Oscillospiraceae bacterium]|nr:hypothetical protein [Oscillospiraceae bacterium]